MIRRLLGGMLATISLEPLHWSASAQQVAGGTTSSDSASLVATVHAVCGADVVDRGQGMLQGTVRDAANRPVGSAAVTVAWHSAADGALGAGRPPAQSPEITLGSFSGANGTWLACGVPLGVSVTIRAVADPGRDEQQTTLYPLSPFDVVTLTLDAPRVPSLAPVRVVGGREILPRHQEFKQRRLLGQTTASFTEEDIRRRNPVDTWQMLTGVSAIKVIPNGNGQFAKSNRGMRLAFNRATRQMEMRPCWYRVMIDGVPLPDSMPDLSNLPRPVEVHGIEVFAGPATVPPQYSSVNAGNGDNGSNSCGLIAIWTK